MYAVIEDRNQQYRVEPGQRLQLPLNKTLEAGASLTFDKVCVVGGDDTRVGTPFVDGATVTATVLGNSKGPKLQIMKFRRRKNSRRRTGFRAQYTELRIDSIDG